MKIDTFQAVRPELSVTLHVIPVMLIDYYRGTRSARPLSSPTNLNRRAKSP